MASVSVSLCSEQGLCFCKATKQADGRYEVEVDYVELERGGIDGSVLLRAVRAAPLLSKYTRVVVSLDSIIMDIVLRVSCCRVGVLVGFPGLAGVETAAGSSQAASLEEPYACSITPMVDMGLRLAF